MLNISSFERFVMLRARLIAMRFESDADNVTYQNGRPTRSASISAMAIASSVGASDVTPRFRIWSAMPRVTALSGE